MTYPPLSGTAVPRDYVEFPSQLLEHWLSTPEVLQRFALHYQTGKPIPQELVDRIKRASTFNQGFATTEYLSAALVDMKLHLAGDTKIDPDAFERETLAELGMPREIVMRHRTPQFVHVFVERRLFGRLLQLSLVRRDHRRCVRGVHRGGRAVRQGGRGAAQASFSVGNTVDPAEAYRAFRGRDPKVEALMKKRGSSRSGRSNNGTSNKRVRARRT